MGVRLDGRSISGIPAGEERRGLGGNSQDVFLMRFFIFKQFSIDIFTI